MKIRNDRKAMWKFDKEANKKGLSEKEMIENYESEFDIYVLKNNPEIHVFKEYNLHQIYLKANT